MQFWDCPVCGCGAIAGSLDFCPVCETASPEPRDVPAEEPGASPVSGQTGSEPPQVHEEEGWGSDA